MTRKSCSMRGRDVYRSTQWYLKFKRQRRRSRTCLFLGGWSGVCSQSKAGKKASLKNSRLISGCFHIRSNPFISFKWHRYHRERATVPQDVYKAMVAVLSSSWVKTVESLDDCVHHKVRKTRLSASRVQTPQRDNLPFLRWVSATVCNHG